MKKLLRKIFRPGEKPREGEIKRFSEKQRQEEAFDERDLGVRPAELNRIVGSVGRYRDFDARFRLKRNLPSDRLEKIKAAMKQGKTLPPVKLYQIKNEFYVLDGNHRVAAANELDREFIDAHIIEFLPSRNTLENILYREKVDFLGKTRLSDAIVLTEIGQYDYLMKQITEHQRFLTTGDAAPIPLEKAALDWWESIYRPLFTIIENSPLPKSFPDRTVADLYAYISYHQWEKGRKRTYGIGVDQLIPKEMEEFRKKMSNMKELDPPEMTHWISAFILISVKVGREYRVMDKLFTLPEVAEVHCMHGAFDLLAKIVLKRELLSSDAEIIGQFVHKNVRRIPDVAKTQTMIPISSKQREHQAR